MKEKNLSVELDTGDTVSAVLSRPDSERADTCIAVAHGAANDMNHPMIRAFAQGMSRKGYYCLRFNFLYRERQKKSIDPEHRLIHAFQRALETVRRESRCSRVIAAGKSLGARMAAQAAASGSIKPNGMIFLGYPLHAPGKKEMLRDAPLHNIAAPMLFFEGTRDPFCDLLLLKEVFSRLTAPRDLVIIENGDHGFTLPKADPTPAAAVYATIINTAADWLSTLGQP